MTGLAYLVAAVLDVALGVSFTGATLEPVFFLLMFLFVTASALLSPRVMNRAEQLSVLRFFYLVLAVLYTAAALLSWKGIMDWGSTSHNLAMCVWDFSLSTVYLYLFVLHG